MKHAFEGLQFDPRLRLASLPFFYIQVLKRSWSIAETPYPKRAIRLPQILTPEEVARLIDAAELPFYRTLLMTMYGTGARRAEVAHLKVGDIDSRRVRVPGAQLAHRLHLVSSRTKPSPRVSHRVPIWSGCTTSGDGRCFHMAGILYR